MTTATLDNLTCDAVRDEANTADELARLHGTTGYFMAGVIDAVTGDADFFDEVNWCEPSEAAREQYRAGYLHGRWMLDMEALAAERENYAAGWEECYAIAAVEAAYAAADPTPVPAWDMPF